MAGTLQPLFDAVARNGKVTLGLPSAGLIRHHASRFLGASANGVAVESVSQERTLIDALCTGKEEIEISFRGIGGLCCFRAPIVQRIEEFTVNEKTKVAALLVGTPEKLVSHQRRSNYRVRVRSDSGVGAMFWRIGERANLSDKPLSAAKISATVHDLSVGGIGIFVQPLPGKPTRMLIGERLRIELTYDGVQTLYDGWVRTAPDGIIDATTRVGVQFKTLEASLEGRKKLAIIDKIIGALQREELRRSRLGLSND